ncbi:MAG: hypothetical protein AB3N23_08150 [Paracoccaceae bacterium]
MKIVWVALCASVVLSACTATSLTPNEQALKPACSAGDLGACSEIGHMVRERKGFGW